MRPTNKLRFVEREKKMYDPLHERYRDMPYRVLQQWWEKDTYANGVQGEWRDVPLEVEE